MARFGRHSVPETKGTATAVQDPVGPAACQSSTTRESTSPLNRSTGSPSSSTRWMAPGSAGECVRWLAPMAVLPSDRARRPGQG